MCYNGSEYHKENARKASIKGIEKIKQLTEDKRNDYLLNPKLCLFCNQIIEYEKRNENKFCNSSCASKFNNKNRTHSEETKRKISISLLNRHVNKQNNNKSCIITNKYNICKVCKKEFKVKRLLTGKFSNSKTCSDNCRTILKSRESKKAAQIRIQNGTHNGWNSRNIISYPEKFFIDVLTKNDIKFIHNYPILKHKLGLDTPGNYFLDFYMEDKNIDLEIDGKQHNYRFEHDLLRDEILNKNGFHVYRIKWKSINNEIGKEYIKNEINKFLDFYNTLIK